MFRETWINLQPNSTRNLFSLVRGRATKTSPKSARKLLEGDPSPRAHLLSAKRDEQAAEEEVHIFISFLLSD